MSCLNLDEKFCLNLSSNEYGQMKYIINVKDGHERCNVHLNIESDLSFIPEILVQIDEILENTIDNNTSENAINPIENKIPILKKVSIFIPINLNSFPGTKGLKKIKLDKTKNIMETICPMKKSKRPNKVKINSVKE